MNTRILFAAFPALLFSCAAMGAEGKIIILSPAEGAVVNIQDKIPVSYEADMGPKGNHLHLYLDDRRMDVLREAKGSSELRIRTPGAHQICLTINTSWHFSTGVKRCVNVTAK